MKITNRSITHVGVLLGAGLLALTGCAAADAPATPAEDVATTMADSVTMTDAWVKAADSGMSAGFGMLMNTGGTDVTVVSATTEASPMVQLHETVADSSGAMVMREIDGGFSIGAGKTLALEPGGNHIMLMDLAHPVMAGDNVTFTLTFSDGSQYDFTAPVKDYSGANENYVEGDSDMDMDMGDK